MGVGWGYGANMLTKYLAEVGEKTPLTAATCIDNPFDLEEATRSSPHHLALDQMLAGGLIDILRSNKELFQGRAKGFDVEKALSAKSVRDFEKAISMVSYGFEAIEDFYSNSSTQGVVGNVKIPVLFIQNDDETVPLFSIPRGVIAENPFTSLLLCSCSSSNSTARDRAAVIWCQNLTIEWLTAVELGLLKGRHPLLKDVDVTINPSKGLALVEGIASDPAAEMLEDGESATSFHFGAGQVSKKDVELDVKGLYEMHNGAVAQTSSVEAEFVEKDEAGAEDGKRGEVLLTAEVIMNVLDITMPGILKENEKKKVLAAVDQGETLVKALQDAVPEDVREKLTTAVSGILHAQGTNLKFDGLLDIDRIPSISPVIRSKTSRLVGGISNAEVLSKDSPLSDQMKSSDDLMDDSNNSHPKTDKLVTGLGSEPLPFESSQKSGETGQLISGHHCDISASGRKSSNETGINHENGKFIKEKLSPSSDSSEKGSENGVKPSTINQAEKSGTTEEAISDGYRVDLDVGGARPEIKEDNVEKNEGKTLDSSTDQNKMTSTNMAEQAVSSQVPSSETHQVEKEGNDHQKKENRSAQSVPDPSKSVVSDSNTPAFSVSQALDALTGMDDSTQVAVNSVFGVIENMISQLEYENNDGNEVKDEKIDSLSEKQQIVSDHTLGKKKDNDNDPSDTSHDPHLYNWRENSMYPYSDARTAWVEEQHCQDSISYDENSTDGSHGNNEANKLGMESKKKDNLVGSKLLADYSDRHVNKVLPYMSPNQYWNSLHNEYFPGYLLSELPNTKPLDVDTTAALLLDYYPEEGQWKLLEQPGSVGDSTADVKTNKGMDRQVQTHSPEKSNHADNFIEPSYVILDTEKHQELVGEYEKIDDRSESVKKSDDRSEEVLQFVKVIILDSLKVEVDRRLSASDMKKMKSRFDTDIEKVANAVALAVDHDEGYTYFEGNDINIDCTTEKIGTLHGNNIIRAISSAIQGTSYVRRVVPVGVIVGSSLAALRKYFHVSTAYDGRSDVMATDQTKKSGNKIHEKTSLKEPNEKTNRSSNLNSPIGIKRDEFGSNYSRNDSVMIGAVTAALGASAILVQQKDAQKGEEPIVGSSKSFKEKGTLHKEPDKLEEATSEKNQSNIVTSLAEKAMSVAGPVVPTKGDGEVDQDRLVAMLADLGQKGGILRLVGKIALLWGGLRGAMSLTDRLISFLHIAERPLFQRILGFVSMLLVLWSPVFVPLLPTIVRSWTTSNPSRMAELACIIGLYTAVLILVMLWGKRIRGYENPLQQYGLDLTSSAKIQDSLKGFIGGIIVVLLIQSVNALIGCVSFSWPTSPPSSLGAMTWLKACGQMLILAGWGIITATGVVLVEELLFRSWLPEEISTDLGYHQGIIMSGLAFSLLQRSLTAIPGLWFLSLALAGARQRMEGSLSIPIGFRTGMMASSFVLQRGGFLTYRPNFPVWIIGSHPFEPFSGAVGLAFSLLLATILYPREHLKGKKGKI